MAQNLLTRRQERIRPLRGIDMQDGRRNGLLDTLRIAVADDDARMREFYVEVLTRMGHKVVAAAANGRELVDDCLNGEVDLVVTDIRMPDMDGIQAAHIITEHTAVPFLFVSAYYEDAEIQGAMMSYSYGYLLKPVKQEDLATSIPIAVQRFRDQGVRDPGPSQSRAG